MRIRFDQIDGFIISLDGKIKHLVLLDYGLIDRIWDKIKYPRNKKTGITNNVNYSFGKIKIDLYNSLHIKKRLIFYNFIILIKSVVNKNENKYYYDMFLEKSFYKYNKQ